MYNVCGLLWKKRETAVFGVEGVLDVVAEDVGFDGLLRVPVEEVGEEDEAGHGIEFFGGGAEGVAEVFGQFTDGQNLEDGMSKDALPAVFDDLPPGRWYDPFEGVEEAVLSGIDRMDHGGRNSFSRLWLSIEWGPKMSRQKKDIRSGYSINYAEI